MNRKKAFWIFVSLAGIGLILWAIKDWNKIKKYFTSKIKTKQEAIDYLMYVSPERNRDVLISFDKAFLIAWANASKLHEITFEYNGKTHYTATGKVKQ